MGFMPKQEYNRLTKGQKAVVDKYHDIRLQNMCSIWQVLWSKKGELHEEFPEAPPSLQEDRDPPPDRYLPPNQMWSHIEEEGIENSAPKTRKPARSAKVTRTQQREVTRDATKKRKATSTPRQGTAARLRKVEVEREIKTAKEQKVLPFRPAVRVYSTLEPLNQFSDRKPLTPSAKPAFMKLQRQEVKGVHKRKSDQQTVGLKHRRVGLDERFQTGKEPKKDRNGPAKSRKRHRGQHEPERDHQSYAPPREVQSKLRRSLCTSLRESAQRVQRKTMKRSRGLSEACVQEQRKSMRLSWNNSLNTPQIPASSTTEAAQNAEVLHIKTRGNAGTKGEPPPGTRVS